MAEQLLTTSIQAPGFQGVNRQDSAVGLDAGYATQADNCVIDKYGRIGARQGWLPAHVANLSIASNPIRFIYEFVTVDGTDYQIAGAGNKLFRLSGGALTEITYGGGATAPVITADNWSGASLNGRLYLYQLGHTPLVFDPEVSTTTYKRISEAAGYLGTVQEANVVISAFGRTWSAGTDADQSTIQFSDILNGQILSTGTSGTLNVSSVWPDGEDEVVALAAHNNLLYIFGRRQILAYQGATNPSTMSLQETITGIGCLARDSVVVAGSDLLFLSDTGVRSLQRTIQEKSAPLRELSINVKDDLTTALEVEDPTHIKAVYSDVHAFYLLSLPVNDIVYCFDLRQLLPSGASRVTTWTGITPSAMYYTDERQLLLGQVGYVGRYTGYTDNGSPYNMIYYTNFFDFGSPTTLKIMKKVGITFVGDSSSNVNLKWGFEYNDTYFTSPQNIVGSISSYYNVGEFGIAEFSTGTFVRTLRTNLGGSGTVIQLGVESSINGNSLSIQRIDCYVKQGKTI